MWWVTLGLPALAAIHLVSNLAEKRRRLQLWQAALAECKLTETESSGFWSWRATLMVRSGPLTAWLTSLTGEKDRVQVVIEGAAGFSLVKLRRQSLKLWTREIEVGDQTFDDKFIIDGQIRPVHALLDETTRRLLVRANAVCDPLEIGDGGLRVKVSEEELPRILPLLLDISRRFAEPLDVKDRISKNARRDPRPSVRLANLLLLVRESPGDPETLKALRRACSDVSPKVRVRAAVELGEEGHDVLFKVAEKSSDDAACALAVSHLGGKLTFERAKLILTRALRKGFSQTARACLEVLGRRRAVAVGTLVRVMERKDELAIAAALALGTTGEAAAEPPLLQALQSEDSNLREAAATALGHVGSVEAVQPLKEAAERFWLDLKLRRATRQAIAEIQARLQGASPGQLSLAEAEAGQLSLAPDDAGRLSLATDQTSQLSLPLEPSGRGGISGTEEGLRPGRGGAA